MNQYLSTWWYSFTRDGPETKPEREKIRIWDDPENSFKFQSCGVEISCKWIATGGGGHGDDDEEEADAHWGPGCSRLGESQIWGDEAKTVTVFAKNNNENVDKSQAIQATLIMKHLWNLKNPHCHTSRSLTWDHVDVRWFCFFFFFLAPPVKRVGGAMLTFPLDLQKAAR